MNSRIRKKIEKRLGCRTYYGYRQKGLKLIAQEFIQDWERRNPDRKEEVQHMVYVVDSKKMDYRHIQKLQVFCDVHPVSSNNGTESNETTFKFHCPVFDNPVIKDWVDGLREGLTESADTNH